MPQLAVFGSDGVLCRPASDGRHSPEGRSGRRDVSDPAPAVVVPLTLRLGRALHDRRHLRGPRVLYQDDGRPLTEETPKRSCCARRGERA